MRRLPLLVLAALGGCTNDTVATAELASGQLYFAVPDTVACLGYVTLSDARRAEVWALGDPADGSRPCGPLSSHRLVYAVDLPTVPTTRPAQELVPGRSYALLGSPGSVVAVFRYNGPASPPTNFKPHSVDWCAVRYPGSSPDWLGQCRVK